MGEVNLITIRDNSLTVMIKDADLRGRMGMAGRRRVEREFTSGKMAREIEKLYQELLAAKSTAKYP